MDQQFIEFRDELKDYLPQIEALLLCSSEPLTLKTLSSILELSEDDIICCLTYLQKDLDNSHHGFIITEIAGGWMYAAKKQYGEIIAKLVKPRLTTLPQASLETLSIIAYRQPVTRAEIEEIRGVGSDSSIGTLLDRKLIYESGRKEVVGRPSQFSTTTDFLKYFGLTSLNDLPKLINEEDFATDEEI